MSNRLRGSKVTAHGAGVALVLGMAVSCGGAPPEGLRLTPDGSGPTVVFDLDVRPLPDIPFPNDVGTRPDPTSATGRRVNASLVAPTGVEASVRANLDALDGFSTWAPITVSFDAPIDLDALVARHGTSLDFEDDAVYLVNLRTGSPVPIDIGYGAFNYVLERTSRYFPNDPRAGSASLVFESVEEDVNENGVLDPGEDSDWDGVLDHPNVLHVGDDPDRDLMSFWERETNTLILRPLIPLDQRTTYAVVLTERLVGEDGQPVRSPFLWVNHTTQTNDLLPLETVMTAFAGGMDVDGIAFAWSFTTQTTTGELEDLRMGLYGQGPFAWLANEFPPDAKLDAAWDDVPNAPVNAFVVPAQDMVDAIGPFASALLGAPEVAEELLAEYVYVDYVVMGRITTPLLIDPSDNAWHVNTATGEASVSVAEIPWMLTIPRERPEAKVMGPWPVAIYVHGTGGDRLQALGFAAHLAKFGIATMGMECYGHGLALPNDLESLLTGLLANAGLGKMAESILDNRTFDMNGDGVSDPAGDFWSWDAFHTRDTVRGSALDVARLIQMLRGFDGTRRWSLDGDGDGTADFEGLAGDFDNDGRVDVAGPNGPYFIFGISLGGIVTSVAAAIEPYVDAAAPIATGGGLIDNALRSIQDGVPEGAVLPMMGPLVLGLPDAMTNEPSLVFYVNSAHAEVALTVHSLDGVLPGDRIRLTNTRSGESDTSVADDTLAFRTAVAVDAGDPIRVDAIDPESGQVVWTADTFDRAVSFKGVDYPSGSPLVAVTSGFGVPRATPRLRRFLQIAQTAIDPGDPINYAPHYVLDPLYHDYPNVGRVTPVALILSIGDMNVPLATGIALARAAGYVPWRETMQDVRFETTDSRVLIDSYVSEGLERLTRFSGPPWNDPREILLDPDALSEGTDGFGAPLLSEPLRLTWPLFGLDGQPGGLGVVRFPYVEPTGHHGFGPSDSRLPFNVHLWSINAIAYYFATGGNLWADDLCLHDASCAFIPSGGL